MTRLLSIALAGALAVFAASVDGKWVAEFETKNRKGGGKQTVVLDLKSDGSALTGNVYAGRRGRGTDIQNGKMDGEKFSFTTVQKNKKGEQKFNWTGTLASDELKLERTREGARRSQSFTAKKQN